jgi:hypothetical protein
MFIAFINNLCANSLKEEERVFVNSGIMLALKKPNGKVRPIVIGSTLVKLAWKVVIKHVCNAAVLSPHQFVGRRPCERAIHKATKDLRHGSTLVSFDAANAFNEIMRAAVHRALLKHTSLHPALHLFYATYLHPSHAMCGTRSVTIAEGVKQGCAAGPFLFLLGISDVINRVAAKHKCSVRAVADDIMLSSTSPTALNDATAELKAELKKIGISLNIDKCLTCGPLAHLLPFKKVASFDYLGSIISENPTSQVSLSNLRPKYACRRSAVDQLLLLSSQDKAHVITKQDIFLLMKYVNITLSYFMANTEPSTTVDLRKEHRQWCINMLSRLLGFKPPLTLTDAQFAQASLAEHDGGMNVVDWLAVAERAYRLSISLQTATANTPQSIFELVHTIQEQLADQLCPAPISTGTGSFKSQPSSQAEHRHYSHSFRNTLRDCDLHISRWHAIRPEEKFLRLDDRQWEMGARLLLGIPIPIPICNDAYTVVNDHALACHACAGHHWRLRHQRILFALQRTLRNAGVHLSTTDFMVSKGLKGDTGPDGLVYGRDKTIAIDVTVAHQPSGERQQRTYQSTGAKLSKYKSLCETNNWDMAPLVFSSFGHPTKRTVRWLRTFASISRQPGVFRKLMFVCSIAVIRGNHDIISLLTTAPTLPSQSA